MSEENIREKEETKSNSVGKESDSWGLKSSLTQRELDVLRRGYGLADEARARVARGSETAKLPVKGYVFVFESHLKFGLRFPIFWLLKEVIDHYEVSIT